MEIYVGFDPGGKGRFGWAICSPEGERLRVLNAGNAEHAQNALLVVKSQLPSQTTITGAGIDAPLFWVANGVRNSDLLVRNAIKKLGAKSPGGTVQQLNSLRGACIVQGPLIAKLLMDEFPSVAITETHPKALLFLLGLANKKNPPGDISTENLSDYIHVDAGKYSEHERDSVLGAMASWISMKQKDEWRDLVQDEQGIMVPFDYKPAYWMPWGLIH